MFQHIYNVLGCQANKVTVHGSSDFIYPEQEHFHLLEIFIRKMYMAIAYVS